MRNIIAYTAVFAILGTFMYLGLAAADRHYRAEALHQQETNVRK